MTFDIPAIASTGLFSFVGSGRREADVIVPVQNQLMAWIYDVQARIPSASVDELQFMLSEAIRHAEDFKSFVYDPAFEDGRASQGALNSVMPWLTGQTASGVYVRFTEDGTPTDGGLIGELQRAILAHGSGDAPALPAVQGAGANILTVDPGGTRYGHGVGTTIPQAGWAPPAISDVWASITGRGDATDDFKTAGIGGGGGLGMLLIAVGLVALMGPMASDTRRPRRRRA